MSSLLYYSISRNFDKTELLEIDKQVAENRKQIFVFLKNKKRIIAVVIILVSAPLLVNYQSAGAMGMAIQPITQPIEIVRPNPYQNQVKVESARVIVPKFQKIKFVADNQLPLYIYLIDERITGKIEVARVIKKIRGGNLEYGLAVCFLIGLFVIIGVAKVDGGFLGVPIFGGDPARPPALQPTSLTYPPCWAVLQRNDQSHPNRKCSIMIGMKNPQSQSSWEDLTQISTPTPVAQMTTFMKENGEVDYDKCLAEVHRRAIAIGNENYKCSTERFMALAVENGNYYSKHAKEAIGVCQGEALGYYKNAIRIDYGTNENGRICGPDFAVTGLKKWKHIQYVDLTSGVARQIKLNLLQKKSSMRQQGKKVGLKIKNQQEYWSNATTRANIRNLNTQISYPEKPENMLALVDMIDLLDEEKPIFMDHIMNYSKPDPDFYKNNTSVIFIN